MGDCQDFPWKFLCLTVPKNFGRHLFSVSLIWGIEKLCASQGYVTILLRNFCLAVPKNFAGEPFCAVFRNTSGSEKFYG